MMVPGVPKRTVSPRCKVTTSPTCSSIPLPIPPGIAPALLTEAGLLPSPSIILSQMPSSSDICLELNEDGDESGWELCIEIDSEWAIGFLLCF